jgi:D-glycero-beta-D-manno-heptose-7-phosphate kinase
MNEQLLKILDLFIKRKIVVVGDLIADEFLYGRISRVSREAPVLVLEYRNLIRLPGGAANAANNLLDLGCAVTLAGIVGEDVPGNDLVSMLKNKRMNIQPLVRHPHYVTPVKTRILAGAHHSSPQQVVRVDRIQSAPAMVQIPWKVLKQSLKSAHGIIVSDYGYGAIHPELFRNLRLTSEELNIPLVVDSRFNMSGFTGATAITPNITELEASTGIAIGEDTALLAKVGRRVLRQQRLQSLLVTQGRFGMTILEPRKAPLHIPIYGTDEVADVTGAGDTVIAVYTLALACGAKPEYAARLANCAGGIVVMKRGTATVSREELTAAVANSR